MKLKYKIFLSIAILLIGLLVSLSIINLPKINETIDDLEKKNAKEVLDKVYHIVKSASCRIEEYKQNALDYHKKQLKTATQVACFILENYYKAYKTGKMSEDEAKQKAFKDISNIRYGENGYFFILDDDVILVSHPNQKIVGSDHSKLKDINGKRFSFEMVNKTRKNKESHTTYWWAKIKGKEYKKLSYTKLFEPWMLYIGTGVYIDEIEKELETQKEVLKDELTKIMNNTKIGKTGYIYIFKKDGQIIIHPNKSLHREKFKFIKNHNTKNYLYKDLINAVDSEKGLRYKWNKLEDKEHFIYDKISWVKYEPKLGWYIASSIYIDELHETSKILLKYVILDVFIFLVIALILAIIFTKKTVAPLEKVLNAVKSVKNGDYSTRIKIDTKDEIGELANGFNSMAQKVEDNIKNLDQRIKQKTAKLELLNKTLEDKVKVAIKETQQKEKMLQQQSRMAQMGEMIGMIAHQWRQPLSAINSAIINIQSKLTIGKFDLSNKDDRENFLQFLDKKHNNITGYVQNLSETIDDFRSFFKPNKKQEIVSLVQPINRALAIVKASMRAKGIEINCDFKIDDNIQMYQNEIMQVILNILKNSEDNFIEKNIQNSKIDISTYKQDDNYIICIKDNGGGILKDILPNIFDPYFSTKDEKNGTGLGLYMSKIMIEEHHNGKIEAKNIDGGVEFIIKLENLNEKKI